MPKRYKSKSIPELKKEIKEKKARYKKMCETYTSYETLTEDTLKRIHLRDRIKALEGDLRRRERAKK